MNLGLDTVLQLNPVTFNWKYNNQSDYGFLAEDLEKINPMLVFYNQQGQVEGVKYDRLTAVLANAIQEQQTQIAGIFNQVAAKIRAGLIETKKLIVDGVDILKKLNELSVKVESQQKQIEELKKTVKELKK